MVIIPICIFTIAFREKVSALEGREGGKEEAMDMLRFVFCSAYLAVGQMRGVSVRKLSRCLCDVY